MKIVVWNMAGEPENWAILRGWPELADADIALLTEATPPPVGVKAVGEKATTGLEAALGPDRPVNRPWAAVVATNLPHERITDARIDRYYREKLPFEPSRPGTWTAVKADLGGTWITAVSLYGLMDERSDASVHRSLSELSPFFDHEEYGRHLLLGGDLNVLAGRPVRNYLDRHQVVLARIRAYGLRDCLERMRVPGALPNCPCGLGASCRHTWTKRDKERPETPYQDDYLFASRALEARLESCRALPFEDDSPSDHAPIVAMFDM